VTVDVGAHKLLILQMWEATQPKTFFVSNGLSAMGYALPAAIAMKLARPDVPVAAVTGDGGLLMYAGEFGDPCPASARPSSCSSWLMRRWR